MIPLEQRAAKVVELAKAAKVTLATAESCTAGALAMLLADAPGAAERFHGGFVVYTKQNKTAALGVPALAFASSVRTPFAFGTLKLHRIEAACIPTNIASIRLLEKTGFKREGFARKYLCIDGHWQDHLLYARLEEDG